MSKISKEEVERIAQLARIELSEKDTEKYQKELSGILDYIEVLNKADTSAIDPTAQVTGLLNVYEEDEKISSLPREEILKNAPDKKDGYIRVKPVLD